METTLTFLTIPDQIFEMEELWQTEDFRGSVKVVKVLLNVLEGAKDIGIPHWNVHWTQVIPPKWAWRVYLTETGSVHTLWKETVAVYVGH